MFYDKYTLHIAIDGRWKSLESNPSGDVKCVLLCHFLHYPDSPSTLADPPPPCFLIKEEMGLSSSIQNQDFLLSIAPSMKVLLITSLNLNTCRVSRATMGCGVNGRCSDCYLDVDGNNITRPFRVAGAAAFIDKGLRKIQKYFNFPSLVYAFGLVVCMVAGSCLTVVGLLILSRWGK